MSTITAVSRDSHHYELKPVILIFKWIHKLILDLFFSPWKLEVHNSDKSRSCATAYKLRLKAINVLMGFLPY